MKEKLIDIVKDIDACAKDRKNTGISPIARVRCVFDGKEESFWFTNGQYISFDNRRLNKYGRFVPKNSNIAIRMQTMDVGASFEYETPNRIKKIVSHRVKLENRSDFQNQTISIAGDRIPYQYRSISEFLNALQQNRYDIIDVETKIEELNQRIEELKKQKDTSREQAQIKRSINEYQKEYRILTQQQEDLKNITIYIRKQGEMRYSLIVDTVQTRIKSQNLFDGKTVIINGGPGTGKSTTMIHRLAYLTDTFAIDEDEKNKIFNYKLNASQRKQLCDAITTQRDWMFFSPSQILKEYLAAAMNKEGLKNTSQKVWHWKEYCRIILQANYGLLENADNKAPFMVCNLTGTLFYQNSNIIEEFTKFYLQQLQNIKSQLPILDTEGKNYIWTTIAQNIQKRFEDSESFDLSRFVSLFNSLESVYANDCKSLLREKNTIINDVSQEIFHLLDKNRTLKSDIEDLLDLTSDSDNPAEFEIVEDDEETEDEEIDKSSNSFTGKKAKEEKLTDNIRFNDEIQKWLKAYCNSTIKKGSQLSDEHQLVSEILLPLIGEQFDKQIKKISDLMVFEQFAQYTRGVKAIMLNVIPSQYKKFRSYLNKSKYDGCDLVLLRDVMQRKQGKELHHQEQSLLLGFINTLVKQIKASTNSKIKHPYIEAYEEVSRPIIGIDEATDFSACDIYAMQSLLTREFNSLTLCGDMMQRLTTYGIKSWDELNSIVSEPIVVEMRTSYRQSKKLLDVARQLYIDTMNETPNYKAFMKSSKVPAPLAFVSENETSKIRWISKRISEVYRAYGEQLPSIAIFVNDKGYIPRFIESLQSMEFFSENKVIVLDGTNGATGMSENHICVYPIDVVKGMEFDVVFFHNIDNASVNMDLLKRYIYVGVSRAAFFLGITMNEQNNEIDKYFEKNKDWFKI